MSRGVIQMHHSGPVKALAAIRNNPGIQREALAHAIGCSVGHTGSILQALTRENAAGYVPIGDVDGSRALGWYVAEQLPEAIRAWGEIAAERKRNRARKGLDALNKRKKTEIDGEWLSKMPVHRLVSAKSKRPLPFVVKAPNSVFALGGME